MWSQGAREDLARERAASAQLATKLDTLDRELSFKIQAHLLLHFCPTPLPPNSSTPQVLEEQLEQERRRTTLDFSDRDCKLKSEYERRLQAELRGLRKRYRQETDKTKKEFMNVHLAKVMFVSHYIFLLKALLEFVVQVGELQEQVSEERVRGRSGREELVVVQGRLEELRRRVAELEETNLGLGQKAEGLAAALEDDAANHRAMLRAKEEEVHLLLLTFVLLLLLP